MVEFLPKAPPDFCRIAVGSESFEQWTRIKRGFVSTDHIRPTDVLKTDHELSLLCGSVFHHSWWIVGNTDISFPESGPVRETSVLPTIRPGLGRASSSRDRRVIGPLSTSDTSLAGNTNVREISKKIYVQRPL
jgi:hypothetical protein